MTPSDLAGAWRGEAERLRTRYGRDDLAALAEAHADELEEAIREAEDELLSPAEAARESGYSERRLRELRTEGRLVDYGEPGRPRYRRGELPRRATASGGPWDADAHVAAIVEGR